MKQITLQIPDKEYGFFMSLVQRLGFVKIAEDDDSKEQVEANLREAFTELQMIKKGVKKPTPLSDFLKEL